MLVIKNSDVYKDFRADPQTYKVPEAPFVCASLSSLLLTLQTWI